MRRQLDVKVEELFTPSQCRAARGLLDWPVEELAKRARLSVEDIKLNEAGRLPRSMFLHHYAIRDVFDDADVLPIPGERAGEGVRFRRRAAGGWAQ